MDPIQENSGDIGGSGGEGSAGTIEIKIKTLDSQSYTIQVEKNVSVISLLENLTENLSKIASLLLVKCTICRVLTVKGVGSRWQFLL